MERQAKKIGRPTKLTPELQQRICEVVKRGHYIITACRAAGISYEAFNEWQERARKGEEPYLQFMQAFEKAEAESEINLFDTVLEAATVKKEPIPAIIASERRWPQRYGRRDRLEVEQHSIEDIRITVSFVPVRPLGQIVEGEVKELGPEGFMPQALADSP